MIETCSVFSLCDQFKFEKLKAYCQDSFSSELYKELISVEFQEQEFFIFEYGVIVFWGQKGYNPEFFFNQLEKYFINPKNQSEIELFKASIANKSETEFKIRKDHIQLNTDEKMVRISISFGMAQSINLINLEQIVSEEITSHADIPIKLAHKGNLNLSRKEMSKIKGKIFLTESKVNLKFDLLDKPEFLWDHPEYDEYYLKTYEYLEVEQRLDILNKKLSVLRDIITILSDELQFKHSSRLEWIIIILIAFEFGFTLYKEFFN